MEQYNISLTSTIHSSTNQSINNGSTIAMNKNTFMRYAQVVYVATLVILGVCGNIICAIVFCTKSLRRIRSSAYLFTLALIDVFFLLDLLPGMIHTAFRIDVYRKFHFICNVQTYTAFIASFIHIWMVLAFTAERFFAVNFPLKHMSQCTPKFSRGTILIIIIPALICYIHPAFFTTNVDEIGQCREKDGYERYLNNLNLIDTIMTMFLPFILVSILNILIIRKLFCSKTFRQHVFANGSRYQCRRTSNWTQKPNTNVVQKNSSTPPPQPVTNPAVPYRSQRIIRPLRSNNTTQRKFCLYRTFTNSDSSQTNPNNNSVNEQQPSPKAKQTLSSSASSSSAKRNESAQRHVITELRLTKMLLAISLTCLSLNFPSYYLRLIVFYKKSKDGSSPSEETNSHPIDFSFYRDIIFIHISYLSYSINIVIYLLFGGNFRRALKRLFSLTSEKKRSENFNSTSRGTNLSIHDKQCGHTCDYESTGIVSTSPNGSLRGYSKSFKLREQASLRRTLRQQQLLMCQQNKT